MPLRQKGEAAKELELRRDKKTQKTGAERVQGSKQRLRLARSHGFAHNIRSVWHATDPITRSYVGTCAKNYNYVHPHDQSNISPKQTTLLKHTCPHENNANYVSNYGCTKLAGVPLSLYREKSGGQSD